MPLQFEQLGPYKLGRKLGRGGMGTVYEAVNVHNNQPAAVKLLNPHLADEEGFRDRFGVEIETLKKLRHPNIVRLYGHGEQDGHLYYAMELVRGENLEEELQAGRRFDWRETTKTGIKLCRALKHAHDHGVIHRDLKPANLILQEDGEVKLTDFGIARLFGNTRLTADGGLIGTAEYMAPEQAEGKLVTYHVDLYSLGCVMFAMLAGRPPFRSKSLPEMLQLQRFAEPPSVSQYAADVPAELEGIIARLLSKTPHERAANADLVARQLAAMEHGLSMPRREAPGDEAPDASPQVNSLASLKTRADETRLPPPPYDPNAPTRIAAAESDEHRVLPPALPLQRAAVTAPFDAHTVDVTGGPADDDIGLETVAAPPGRNRFVTVEEEERLRELERRRDRGPVVAQIVSLSISLALLVGLGWYFLKAPSADQLYARIEERATDENPERLLEAADDVASFLARFPDDERAAQLQKYQDEIELLQLERRFNRRSRQLTRDSSLLPIERDYIEAVNHLSTDPQRTMAELEAIAGAYGGAGSRSDGESQVLELARRQLKRLKEQVREQTPESLSALDYQLKRADELRDTEPQRAQAIWRGIVTLYEDKPWARDRVARAKSALAEAATALPSE